MPFDGWPSLFGHMNDIRWAAGRVPASLAITTRVEWGGCTGNARARGPVGSASGGEALQIVSLRLHIRHGGWCCHLVKWIGVDGGGG